MVEAAENRVAVYIDFDNIVMSRYDEVNGHESFRNDRMRQVGTALQSADPTFVDIGAIIDYATSFGTVVISRAFADWSAPANARYSQQLVDRAVDLTQLFPTAMRQKNGADIRLSVDVVEDMFRLPEITHVVIVAGDSDFIPLAQRCKRLGRYVVGIGVKGSTSKQLAAACNEFTYYGDLPGILPLPAQSKPVAAKASTAKTSPTSKSRSVAVVKPDEDDEETSERKLSATALLVRAMELVQQKDTDQEWLNSSTVKNQMIRIDGSFSEKTLKYKKFSDFVKSRESLVEIAKGAPEGRIRLREIAKPEA